MVDTVTICAAVEGVVDEVVAARLIRHVGAIPGPAYGRKGKPHLHQQISGYNQAAQRAPWLVLVDLDQEADCAPPMRQVWIPAPAPMFCFRIAVRAIEAWLMADAEALASFIGVSRTRIPRDPETIGNPKTELVNIAARSRRRAIREDMVPREGSGRAVGPAYPSRLIEFASEQWRPTEAAATSESVRRAIACLERFTANTGG